MSKIIEKEIFKHSLLASSEVIIRWTLKFANRSTRKLLTKLKYINYKKRLKKLNNYPIMFVRAPKHFKSGKQHIYSFAGNFSIVRVYKNIFSHFFFYKDGVELQKILAHYSPTLIPDTQISRITIKVNVGVQLTTEQKFFFKKSPEQAPLSEIERHNLSINLFSYMQQVDMMGHHEFHTLADWFITNKKTIIANYHYGRKPLEGIENSYPLKINKNLTKYVFDSFSHLNSKEFKKLIYWFRKKQNFLIEMAAVARRDDNFYKFLEEENGGKVNKIIVKTKDPYQKDLYISVLEERVKYLANIEQSENTSKSSYVDVFSREEDVFQEENN